MSCTVIIDGEDRSTYVDFGAHQQCTFTAPVRGTRGTATLQLNIPNGDSFMPGEGAPIRISDDGLVLFTGTIDNLTLKSQMTFPPADLPLATFVTLNCVSEEQRLDKRMFTGSYPAGMTCGDVVSDLIGVQFADEDITLGTIQAGATLVAAITLVNARVSDIITQLAGYSSSASFTWGITDGVLFFQAQDETPAPFGFIDDTMLLTPSPPSKKFDRQTYRNVQHVQINTNNLAPLMESFSGDGSKNSFDVAYPIDTVDSIVVTGGSATAVAQTGTFIGIPSDGDTFSWGPNEGQTYTFRDNPVQIWDVQIDHSTAAGNGFRLANAINGTDDWLSAAGQWHASISDATSAEITFGSRTPGSFAPTITTTCAPDVFTWSQAGLQQRGAFTSLPADGDTVTIHGAQIPVNIVYTFRNAPVNPYDVQIFAGDLTTTVELLTQFINGYGDLAPVGSSQWVTAIDYDVTGGEGIRFTIQTAGVFVTVESGSYVDGSSSGPGTDDVTGSQTFAESGAAVNSNAVWEYTAGKTTFKQTANQTPPPNGSTVVITYQPVGFGNITVENPTEIAARKMIEGGSGIYENAVNRPDLTTIAAGMQVAQALLEAYDSIADTVTFPTYEWGVLPGMFISIESIRLQIPTTEYLVTQLSGFFEKTNESNNHFRFQVTCVKQPLQRTWQDVFIKMAPQGLGTGTAAQTGALPGSGGSTVGGAPVISWEANFGINDDTGGINAATKYAPVTASGYPVRGLITVVTLPTLPVILDVKASVDKGQTWASIFTDGSQLQIPQLNTIPNNPNVYALNAFANMNIPAGSILRLDVIDGNHGAQGIVVWLAGGPSGTTGYEASGAIDSAGLLFAGMDVI